SLTVDFANLSSGPIMGYLWRFGDGNLSTATNSENVYTNSGEYTVSLTGFTADATNSLVLNNYVVVTNPPPVVADFSLAPANGVAPLTVNFTNLSTGSSSTSDFCAGNSALGDGPTQIAPSTAYFTNLNGI